MSNTGFNKTENKIKYPIDDSLILKDPTKYGVDNNTYNVIYFFIKRPEPKAVDIPTHLCNKIISLWDYLVSFKTILGIEVNYSFEELYTYIMNKNNTVLGKLYQTLIKLIAQSIELNDNDETNLVIIKTVIDNPDLSTRLKRCWYEINKLIAGSKKFSLMLANSVKEILARSNISYDDLSTEQHVELISYLVNSSYDTTQIKSAIREEMDKKAVVMREKQFLEHEQ
jgi:hypothetical protein